MELPYHHRHEYKLWESLWTIPGKMDNRGSIQGMQTIFQTGEMSGRAFQWTDSWLHHSVDNPYLSVIGKSLLQLWNHRRAVCGHRWPAHIDDTMAKDNEFDSKNHEGNISINQWADFWAYEKADYKQPWWIEKSFQFNKSRIKIRIKN